MNPGEERGRREVQGEGLQLRGQDDNQIRS
jgi:hypothetical protein